MNELPAPKKPQPKLKAQPKPLIERIFDLPVIGALVFVVLYAAVALALFFSSRRVFLTIAFLGALTFAAISVIEPRDALYWVWPVITLGYILTWFVFERSTRHQRTK